MADFFEANFRQVPAEDMNQPAYRDLNEAPFVRLSLYNAEATVVGTREMERAQMMYRHPFETRLLQIEEEVKKFRSQIAV